MNWGSEMEFECRPKNPIGEFFGPNFARPYDRPFPPGAGYPYGG